ncbi:MAG: SDR family oxidoreductase [Planctomycetota bacterium]
MAGTMILGATGFLGAHLVAAAFEEARELATMADPLGPPVWAVGRKIEDAPRFTEPRGAARWIAADLLEEGALEDLFERCAPERVVLAAALARAAACEADPELARRMNAELPGRVAARCHAAGIRFVFVSTDQVFGGEPAPKKGFRESDTPAPVSVYGHSKRAGEVAVLAADPQALVVRLPLLYGDSGGRGLGASDSLLEAVEADQIPPLFTDEFRSPLEVGNAADAVMECALRDDLHGLLHVAGKQIVSRYELGLAILDAMGLPADQARELVRATTLAEVQTGAPRAANTALDAREASRLLETPLLGLRRGLERAMGPG